MAKIRIKASMSGDTTVVKFLVPHPMESGFRKDKKTGKLVPAHFINHMSATIAGKLVLDAQLGGGISKDPFMEFRVKGPKSGDKVVISWEDNKGEKGSGEAAIA